MITLNDTTTVYFDVDDTLIKWHPIEADLMIVGHAVVIIKSTVVYLKACAKKGNVVVVWSQNGAGWGSQVVQALGLEQYVDLCVGKPNIFVDDCEQSSWMGEWIQVTSDGGLRKDAFNNDVNDIIPGAI